MTAGSRTSRSGCSPPSPRRRPRATPAGPPTAARPRRATWSCRGATRRSIAPRATWSRRGAGGGVDVWPDRAARHRAGDPPGRRRARLHRDAPDRADPAAPPRRPAARDGRRRGHQARLRARSHGAARQPAPRAARDPRRCHGRAPADRTDRGRRARCRAPARRADRARGAAERRRASRGATARTGRWAPPECSASPPRRSCSPTTPARSGSTSSRPTPTI